MVTATGTRTASPFASVSLTANSTLLRRSVTGTLVTLTKPVELTAAHSGASTSSYP